MLHFVSRRFHCNLTTLDGGAGGGGGGYFVAMNNKLKTMYQNALKTCLRSGCVNYFCQRLSETHKTLFAHLRTTLCHFFFSRNLTVDMCYIT